MPFRRTKVSDHRASGLRALLLSVLLSLPSMVGCRASEPRTPETSSQPEAVVIDFYQAGHRTRGCSGTLLAQNVVLTAAHCLDGSTAARVVAPGAGGKSAPVSRRCCRSPLIELAVDG